LSEYFEREKELRHVAIIMDGNGRWARARGLPRAAGHRRGADAVKRTAQAAVELGVDYLTLFGFSSENWNRPQGEVDDLMGLMRRYLKAEISELCKNEIRLKVIGERHRLPADIVALIEDAERRTRDFSRLNLTIAISYGGRQDILQAARAMAQAVAAGTLHPEEIEEADFAGALSTAGIPDPDLVIRTSGEQRISNFLLWQCAYSEMVFLHKLWPDFGKEDLAQAVAEYSRRDRRFGKAVSSG
jgi:undecaprenyl diphosphate synthase